MEQKKEYDSIDEKLNPKLEQRGEEIEDNIENQVNKSTKNLTDCHKKIKSLENEFLMEEESNLEYILMPESQIVKKSLFVHYNS